MKTAKYEVGQKVRVRNGLVNGNDYGGLYFNNSMKKLCGQEFVIESVVEINEFMSSQQYNLEGVGWYFNEEMLEPVEEKKLKLPSKVIELERTAKIEIYVERVIVNDPAIIMFYRTALYDYTTGDFSKWSDTKKIVAKCNKDIGDEFSVESGVNVAMLKAYRKEIEKQLRKY